MNQLVRSTKFEGTLADTHCGDIWASHLYQPKGKRKHTFLSIQEIPNLEVCHEAAGETTWITPEGRYVGLDGFLTPLNVEEFFSRYPDYVSAFAYQLMHRKVQGHRFDIDTFDDVASELMMHLCNLPPAQEGYRRGFRDRVATFSPSRQHGAKKGQYFNYINTILQNRFSSYVYDKLLREPAAVSNGIMTDISEATNEPTEGGFLYVPMPDTGDDPHEATMDQLDAQSILKKVIHAVKDKDKPRVEAVLRAAMIYDKNTEIAAHLGMKKDEVSRTIRKVRALVLKKGLL